MSDNPPPNDPNRPAQDGPPEGPPRGGDPHEGQPQGPPQQGPPPGWGPPQGQPPGPYQGHPQGPYQGQPQGPYQGRQGHPQGPPQGQPDGWGPPQQPPHPGQHPGWGPPQQPPGHGHQQGWGSPQRPGSGKGRKLALIIGGAALAVVLVVVAVVIGVSQFGGDDDTDTSSSGGGSEPKAKVMTAAGADKLRKQLTDAGWACYDSLDKPVVLKRCFLWKPDGDSQTTGQVSMQYADEDSLSSVDVHVSSPSTVQGKIVQQVAGKMGETLLDGNGAKVQELQQAGSSKGQDVEGVYVSGYEDGVGLLDSDGDHEEIQPKKMPSLAETRSAMEGRGLSCKEADGAITCDGVANGVSIRALATLRNGEVAAGWSLTLSPPNYGNGKVADGAQVAGKFLREIGLTDADGQSFVAKNTETGKEGDFAGYHVSVNSGGNTGSYYMLMISLDEIH